MEAGTMRPRNFSRSVTLRGLASCLAVALLAYGRVSSQDKPGVAPLLRQWEKDVRQRMAKDKTLRFLAAKYPLVVLHSRALYAGGDYKGSAYSFTHQSANPAKHKNDVQLLFHNGGEPRTFQVNQLVGQQNLVVDLGMADFEQTPDPAMISIDGAGVLSAGGEAVDGRVYLERIRDGRGNNFYVLFRVVAVDPASRYMAFVWRKLPGGKAVRP
jgi:hypothetical protein